ncbi:hypothetical protein ACHAXT_000034 [Thalassiosira profunda]
MPSTATLAPLLLLLAAAGGVGAFAPPAPSAAAPPCSSPKARGSPLFALDPVTYLRTEWVAAALCTNQTPRSADKVLQLGCEDGRVVNFVPRTVREIITSSAEPNGEGLTVSCERQLKQMAERRKSAAITYSNQMADNLADTPSSSIDIVISLLAAQRMDENGMDWKQSIREAGRVLKPGGRFLFVESAEVGNENESYLDEVIGMSDIYIETNKEGSQQSTSAGSEGGEEGEEETSPLFEEVGYDQVDMVLQPHIAGVAIKALDADMTPAEKEKMMAQEESDRMAELSLNAFERGSKRKRRKKKKVVAEED